MRHLIFILMGMLLLCHIQAQDVNKEAIAKSIPLDELEHPYLFLNKKDLVKIRVRVKEDPESKQIMDRLLAKAKMLLHMPVDSHIPERGKNVRAGWTEVDRANKYEKKMNTYLDNAQTLAFVFQITEEKKFAQKAYEFAETVCSMPVWVSQAHEFPIIYSRVMPWNVPDNQVNFNFDIRTATLGERMACVYDWTYEALEKHQRDRIRGILLEKVVTPVRGDYEFHWWASSYRCNWTGVCNGGLGVATLALLKEHPTLVDVVAESFNRIDKMMDEIGVDGGWQEGGSYWHYGLLHATRFAVLLKEMSQGQFNLFKNEKLAANPVAKPVYLFIPPNRSVDFGDSRSNRIGSTSFINLLTSETNSKEGAWYREQVLGRGNSLFDILFPRPQLDSKAPSNPSRHFKTIDWWVMRSDFIDPNKVTLAGKAGRNDDPHHGHLDIGHFLLSWKGQAFLKDSGRPYYDEKYFDEARWQYPQASSTGHNVVMVNGEQQIPGKLKDQAFDHSIGGKVLEFRTSQKRDYVLMDPSDAYPKQELRKWQRHILLEKPNITLVLDDIESQSVAPLIDIRFHSEAKDLISSNNFIILEGTDAKMALIPISSNSINIYQESHAYQPVHASRSFEWLPYFGFRTKPTEDQEIVATLVVPIDGLKEAEAIQSSLTLQTGADKIRVFFKYRGDKYDYSFLKKENGFILE